MSELFDKNANDAHAADIESKRQAAIRARDDALDQVEQNNTAAVADFQRCVRIVADRGKPFTTDDVMEAFPHLESYPEKRAFGPAILGLARDNVIAGLNYTDSDRRSSHGRPKRLWIKWANRNVSTT